MFSWLGVDFFEAGGVLFLIWDSLTFSKYRAFSWRQDLEALGSFVPILKEPALFTSRPALLAILSTPT